MIEFFYILPNPIFHLFTTYLSHMLSIYWKITLRNTWFYYTYVCVLYNYTYIISFSV